MVWKYNMVGNSVRLLVVTTTRLATQTGGISPGQETLATESTTTSQPVRCVHRRLILDPGPNLHVSSE
ncbi:hypothetical protein Taro_029831 [Colocasia esculenta]|uniref:Uncharacterized protein n=1 Tax=Colocasia esculenta TaxID=4460 RepID=A0A843VEU0_COLES|nr:hypothetical protein [Colocasia esculenta]